MAIIRKQESDWLMSKLIFYLGVSLFIFVSCKSKVNTYKNDIGMKPATAAMMDSVNYTTIAWSDTIRQFGTVKMGDTVFVSFKFKNSGDKALFVSSAHSSCGCAVVNYSEDAVLPGDGAEITATFRNKYPPGPVHQTIIVTTNTSNKMYHTLTFEGMSADTPVTR